MVYDPFCALLTPLTNDSIDGLGVQHTHTHTHTYIHTHTHTRTHSPRTLVPVRPSGTVGNKLTREGGGEGGGGGAGKRKGRSKGGG